MTKKNKFGANSYVLFLKIFLYCICIDQNSFCFESVTDKKVMGVGYITDLEVFVPEQTYIMSHIGVYILDIETGKFINRHKDNYTESSKYIISPNGKWFLSRGYNIRNPKNILLESFTGNVYDDLSIYNVPWRPFSKSGEYLLLNRDQDLYEYDIENKNATLIAPNFFNDHKSFIDIQYADDSRNVIAGLENVSINGGVSYPVVEFFLWNRESKEKTFTNILGSNGPSEGMGGFSYDSHKKRLFIIKSYTSGMAGSSFLFVFDFTKSNNYCGYIVTGNQSGIYFDFADNYSVFTFGISSQVNLWNYDGICENNKNSLVGPIYPHRTSDYSNDSLNWYYIQNVSGYDLNNYNLNSVSLSTLKTEALFDLRSEIYHTSSISLDGKNIAIKNDYKDVFLWDIEKLRIIQKIETVPGEGNIAFSPKSHQLIWAASETVSVWDNGGSGEWSKQKDIIAVENAGNTHVAYSQDGSLFLIAGGTADQNALNDVLEVWQSDTIKQKIALSEVGDGIQKAFFSPNDESMAAVYADGKILIWDVHSGEKLQEWKHSTRIDYVEFRDDDELLLVDSERNLYVYRPEEQTFEKKVENLALPVKYIKKANLLLAGNQTIDVNTFQILKTLDSVKQDMASIELSPDESIMVLCRANGEITEFETDRILDGGNSVNMYKIHEK